MSAFPRDPSFDSSIAFLTEGYRFILNRCERFGTDAFETRLLLKKAICVMGADAARMFYHPDRFTRNGAIPATTVMLLQDFRSVQTLSGAQHRHRKQMFLSLVSPDTLQRLAERTAYHWGAFAAQWERRPSIVLQDEVERVLCTAILEWCGIPATAQEIALRTREFSAMVDGAGSVGPRNWRGIWCRSSSEAWVQDVIRRIRQRGARNTSGKAAEVIAWHRDENGQLLDVQVAGVELLNVLRATVAVARFSTFAAVALAEGKASRERLATDDDYLQSFVHEVRRYYPFIPAMAGLVQIPFEWRGVPFAKGTWVIFDIYGTGHDRRLWRDPEAFQADRYLKQSPSPYELVPHGGGQPANSHRCPGEPIAIALTNVLVRLLAGFIDYKVPRQDLTISLARVPAIPASRMVVSHVRRRTLPSARELETLRGAGTS